VKGRPRPSRGDSLCAAAAVTKTIKLATGICLLIERDTIVTAKETATVDRPGASPPVAAIAQA
jgi:alkanesulfonate monooxygenase SsuD/methylene tetrahydromethanopterin reductase-like flavin-dependent oxidoreductase (luciferase family)